MRWRGRQRSSNVEDRRGLSPRLAMGGGAGVLGILVLLALQLFDAPPVARQLVQDALQQQAAPPAGPGIEDDAREFISVVLRDTEAVWTDLFQQQISNAAYQEPRLVLYSGQTSTACGIGDARMGPFYCPADRMIYIDPVFFEDLARRHQAPGDFAQAYVIAHEVAHHVQVLLGYSDIVSQIRQRGDEREANRASVRLELQADFLAGVWAHHADRQYDILQPGDMEEAIRAANQIGDDTLQRQSGAVVVPDRFTHGTSAQRVRWFRRGLESGQLSDLDLLFETAYDRL